MQPDAILALAARASRSTRRRFGLEWSREDQDDATQEAAAGILRALRDRPGMGEGYYFRSGAQAATRYAFRRSSLYAQRLGAWIEDGGVEPIAPDRGWSRPLSDADVLRLRPLLARTRRKKDARGGPRMRDSLAVERDLLILRGLSEGLSHATIGEQLSLPKGHVNKYRQAIRKRLRAALVEQSNADSVAIA